MDTQQILDTFWVANRGDGFAKIPCAASKILR